MRAVKLTSHFPLLSRFRMSGSVPPFPFSPNSIKFCTGSNLSLLFLFIVVVALVVVVVVVALVVFVVVAIVVVVL